MRGRGACWRLQRSLRGISRLFAGVRVANGWLLLFLALAAASGLFVLRSGHGLSQPSRDARFGFAGQSPAPARPEREYRNMTHAYRSCYLSTATRRFARTPGHYALSHRHRVLYLEVPKSGSRTIRKQLNSRIYPGPLEPHQFRNYFRFTCVRDPLKRFVSVFNFIRHKYAKEWCPDGICASKNAIRDARDWADRLLSDGFFEWHLWPQALVLSLPDGSPRDIDMICELRRLQQGFDRVHEARPRLKLRATKGRNTYLQKKFQLVNASQLPRDVVRKLCRAYHVDYCCFDLPFPPECRGMRDEVCLPWADDGSQRYWKNGKGIAGEPKNEPVRPPW